MCLCRYGRVTGQLERERDLGTLRAEIQADQGVRRVLARFGVLKFLENPLMRAGEPLLAWIISYLDPEHEVFVVQGHRIELTVQDVYFLIEIGRAHV